MTLEYLKVILTLPVLGGVILIVMMFKYDSEIRLWFRRIGKVKFPGGEIDVTQQEKKHEDPTPQEKGPAPVTNDNTPAVIDQKDDKSNLIAALESEKVRAALWEYRYLNYFFARSTQHVLDWFATQKNHSTLSLFHTIWMQSIPDAKERFAIIQVLQAHFLITIENDVVIVSPKGEEYIEWRGPIPQP